MNARLTNALNALVKVWSGDAMDPEALAQAQRRLFSDWPGMAHAVSNLTDAAERQPVTGPELAHLTPSIPEDHPLAAFGTLAPTALCGAKVSGRVEGLPVCPRCVDEHLAKSRAEREHHQGDLVNYWNASAQVILAYQKETTDAQASRARGLGLIRSAIVKADLAQDGGGDTRARLREALQEAEA